MRGVPSRNTARWNGRCRSAPAVSTRVLLLAAVAAASTEWPSAPSEQPSGSPAPTSGGPTAVPTANATTGLMLPSTVMPVVPGGSSPQPPPAPPPSSPPPPSPSPPPPTPSPTPSPPPPPPPPSQSPRKPSLPPQPRSPTAAPSPLTAAPATDKVTIVEVSPGTERADDAPPPPPPPQSGSVLHSGSEFLDGQLRVRFRLNSRLMRSCADTSPLIVTDQVDGDRLVFKVTDDGLEVHGLDDDRHAIVKNGFIGHDETTRSIEIIFDDMTKVTLRYYETHEGSKELLYGLSCFAALTGVHNNLPEAPVYDPMRFKVALMKVVNLLGDGETRDSQVPVACSVDNLKELEWTWQSDHSRPARTMSLSVAVASGYFELVGAVPDAKQDWADALQRKQILLEGNSHVMMEPGSLELEVKWLMAEDNKFALDQPSQSSAADNSAPWWPVVVIAVVSVLIIAVVAACVYYFLLSGRSEPPSAEARGPSELRRESSMGNPIAVLSVPRTQIAQPVRGPTVGVAGPTVLRPLATAEIPVSPLAVFDQQRRAAQAACSVASQGSLQGGLHTSAGIVQGTSVPGVQGGTQCMTGGSLQGGNLVVTVGEARYHDRSQGTTASELSQDRLPEDVHQPSMSPPAPLGTTAESAAAVGADGHLGGQYQRPHDGLCFVSGPADCAWDLTEHTETHHGGPDASPGQPRRDSMDYVSHGDTTNTECFDYAQ
eukprot:TRINITY_DN1892_c0_g1_i1.p1 TRINITY_DN1892_c0_g1~~TRINITY_DN1892_c0_g1_i1.p1  ORF type:complete len:713 (+),score=105.11 TRINITY_DN1892_c0_g1_i1:109-2247(+)